MEVDRAVLLGRPGPVHHRAGPVVPGHRARRQVDRAPMEAVGRAVDQGLARDLAREVPARDHGPLQPGRQRAVAGERRDLGALERAIGEPRPVELAVVVAAGHQPAAGGRGIGLALVPGGEQEGRARGPGADRGRGLHLHRRLVVERRVVHRLLPQHHAAARAVEAAGHQVPAPREQRLAAGQGRHGGTVADAQLERATLVEAEPDAAAPALRPGAEQRLPGAPRRGRPDVGLEREARQIAECRARVDHAEGADVDRLAAPGIAAVGRTVDRLGAERRRQRPRLRVDQTDDLGLIPGGADAAHQKAHARAGRHADRIAIAKQGGHRRHPPKRRLLAPTRLVVAVLSRDPGAGPRPRRGLSPIARPS